MNKLLKSCFPNGRPKTLIVLQVIPEVIEDKVLHTFSIRYTPADAMDFVLGNYNH